MRYDLCRFYLLDMGSATWENSDICQDRNSEFEGNL